MQQQLNLFAEPGPGQLPECLENHAGVFSEPTETIAMVPGSNGRTRARIDIAFADGGFYWAYGFDWPLGGCGFKPGRRGYQALNFAESRQGAIADAGEALLATVARSIPDEKDRDRGRIRRFVREAQGLGSASVSLIAD